MKTRSRIGAIGASVALAAAAAGIAMMPAGAAPIAFDTNVQGSLNLTIDGSTSILPLAGSLNNASYDSNTGVVTGNLTLDDGTVQVDVGGNPVDVAFSFTETGSISGGDVSGGSAEFSSTQTMNLLDAAGGAIDLDPCAVGPLTFDFTGTSDASSGNVDVDVDSGNLDVPTPAGTCGGGAIKPEVVNSLEGATVSAAMKFTIPVEGDNGSTTTTTEPDGSTTTTTEPDGSTTTTTVPDGSTTTTTVPDEETGTMILSLTPGVGCDATVTIDFAETGEFSLTGKSEDGRTVVSGDVNVTETGVQDVDILLDKNHGLDADDPVHIELTNADGEVVDSATAAIDDPAACAPDASTEPSPGPGMHAGGAAAATPVSGQPTYTG